MKKIIIGAMLVALSTSIGIQDADAKLKLFGSRQMMGAREVQEKLSANVDLNLIKNVLAELETILEILSQMDLIYQSLYKDLNEESKPNFSKNLFQEHKTILEKLDELLSTIYNGTNEKDFIQALKHAKKLREKALEALNIFAKVATLDTTNLVEEQSETSGLKRNVKLLKAKDNQHRVKVQEESKGNIMGGMNTAGSIDNVIYLMDTTKNALEAFKTKLSENETTANISTEVRERVTNLRESLKKFRSYTDIFSSATKGINLYNAKDTSDKDKALESLKQGTENYYTHLEKVAGILKEIDSSNLENKEPILQNVADTIHVSGEVLTILGDKTRTAKGKKSFFDKFSKKTKKEEITEEQTDEDDAETATEDSEKGTTKKGKETAAKSTSKPKKRSFSLKSFFNRKSDKSQTVRENKSRAIKAI